MQQHVDPDVLALLALGETAGTDAERAHAASCPVCADEVASLAAVVRVGRTVRSEDALLAPPPAVWGRIRDELGLRLDVEEPTPTATGTPTEVSVADRGAAGQGPAGHGSAGHGAADHEAAGHDAAGDGAGGNGAAGQGAGAHGAAGHGTPRGEPAGRRGAGSDELADRRLRRSDDERGAGAGSVTGTGADTEATAAAARPVAPVVPLRRRTPWVLAAAAAGVVVGAAGASLLGGLRDAEPQVLAQATLDPLPGREAQGSAVVEEADDGRRVLVLDLDGAVPEDGFREVWLIDRDVTRLVSLGVLEGAEGRFTVPEGLDLDDFAVVDVSEEPIDGDPTHSGDSVVRGVLDA